jgi:hypothetical protein
MLFFVDAPTSAVGYTGGSLLTVANTSSQGTITHTSSGVELNKFMGQFTTDVGALTSGVVVAGVWELTLYASAALANTTSTYYFDVCTVTGGVETLRASGSGAPASIFNSFASEFECSLYVPGFTISDPETTQIRIKLYANFTSVNDTITLFFRTPTQSYIMTTFLQNNAGGTGPTGPTGYIGVDGSTGPTGPTGTIAPYIFDGGDPFSVYSVGPAFDCGGVT